MAENFTNIRGVCPGCFKLKLCYQRGVGSNIKWICDECFEVNENDVEM